ncbi:hypothetical protein AgCh_021164 [Apium graveolens]
MFVGLTLEMTTLSLLVGKYGRGRRNENFAFELRKYFGQEFVANELVTSSNCVWLRYLGCSRNGNRLRIAAAIRKGKKHDYPWPDNIDPHSTAGALTYLSSFKPLAEKPKPVTLDFEKPLVDLETKIIEISQMADDTGLDFSNQINALEGKYQQALTELYTHLTPIQRLNIARHPNRPTVLDHILNITDRWVELHGDRAGYDDPAIVTGIGRIDGRSYVMIGHQKGRNTKENIARNFAMPTPHGYRKALRMMKYADHHGFPIITFIDTPGAFADLRSEELGQGEAIAYNLRAMFGLKVPIISIVTGEGGSGGALAIGCANKLFMLENSAFYVASPEACAAILWKSSKAAPKAAEKLKITAQEHYKRKIADGIIPEPLGGAHADPKWTSQQIKHAITQAMEELTRMDTEELLHHRMLKYRSIGGFQEGIEVEAQRKRNMKLSEASTWNALDLESDIETLRKRIFEAKEPSDLNNDQAIEKLKKDLDHEMTKAFISMGMQDNIVSLKLELSRAPDRPPNQPLSPGLKEKADKIIQEFKQNLSKPGAYIRLKQKLLKLSTVDRFIEQRENAEKLKREINQKVPTSIKEKTELLKKAQEKLSRGQTLDNDMAEEVQKNKEEVMEFLKTSNLKIVGTAKKKDGIAAANMEKIVKLNKEISEEIKGAVNGTGIGKKIEELKAEVAIDSSSEKVKQLKAEIKEQIRAAMNAKKLQEKVENLRTELRSHKEVDIDGKTSVNHNGRV